MKNALAKRIIMACTAAFCLYLVAMPLCMAAPEDHTQALPRQLVTSVITTSPLKLYLTTFAATMIGIPLTREQLRLC